MKKKLLLLALLGVMLTGCGSDEKPEISNDKPEIEVTNENAVDSELTPDEAYELSMQNPGEKFYFSMGERYFCNGVNYSADYVEPTDEENKQYHLKLVEEQAPTYVEEIIHDFVSKSVRAVQEGRSNSSIKGNIKLDISYDDILAEAEAKGIAVDINEIALDVNEYGSKKNAVNSIIEELMLIKAEELRAECEEKFIEVAKEEIENGKYASPGIILWGEDAKKAVREILNRIDTYHAIDTDEEIQKSLAEEAETDNVPVEGAIYTVDINGVTVTGTIDELVASIPENNGVYSFSISKGNSKSSYFVDKYNVKSAVLEFIKKAEENVEPEVDYMPTAVAYANTYEGALDSLGDYTIWAAHINDSTSPYFSATEIILETSNGDLYRYEHGPVVPLKEYESAGYFGYDKESMYAYIEEYNNNPDERPSLWVIFE